MATRLVAVWMALGAASLTLAERLPVRHYTTLDGLPSDELTSLAIDHAEFLWIGTRDGLARFDGNNWRSFGIEHGLPHEAILSLLETADHELFVGTDQGLARLALDDPSAQRFLELECSGCARWTTADQPAVLALLQDRRGALWVGTTEGLFRFRRGAKDWRGEAMEIGIEVDPQDMIHPRYVYAIAEGHDGALWFGTSTGLYRYSEGQPIQRLSRVEAGWIASSVHQIVPDPSGGVWCNPFELEIERVVVDSRGALSIARRYDHRDRLAAGPKRQLSIEPDGRFLLAGWNGLTVAELDRQGALHELRILGPANGFEQTGFVAIVRDRSGDLWLADAKDGLYRWRMQGSITYEESDGVPSGATGYIGLSSAGEPWLVDFDLHQRVAVWNERGFDAVPIELPDSRRQAWRQRNLQDSTGGWWFNTNDGICRYPAGKSVRALAGQRPLRCYGKRDGLPAGVGGLYEDRHGDLWLSSAGEENKLWRWHRATDRIEPFPVSAGLRAEDNYYPTIIEDGFGAIWLGALTGGLYRWDGNRFQRFGIAEGWPEAEALQAVRDEQGRIWVALYLHGLLRIDPQPVGPPRFVHFSRRSGLPSDSITALALGPDRNLYLASAIGVIQLSTETGATRSFGIDEGFPRSRVKTITVDRQGRVFAGLDRGVVVFTPSPLDREPPPAPLIQSLRLGGRAVPISLTGAGVLRDLETSSAQSSLEAEFATPAIGTSEAPRLAIKIDDAVLDPWAGEPKSRLDLPLLPPGSHHIEVRAVRLNRVESVGFASIDLRVLPPFWRRGWFLISTLCLVAAVGYLVHRLRLGRAVALERVRTRIATDLHDDIGSSLSSIAIQGALLRRRLQHLDEEHRARLHSIATTAGELVETMGDIVWSVNPKYDKLSDLAHRMHHFAREAADGAGLQLQFDSELHDDVELDAATRRQIYLIFKELVANALKHSQATRIEVSFARRAGRLRLLVKDDGRGLPERAKNAFGHGLASMRARAESIGAKLELESIAGGGVTATVEL